MDGPSLDQKGRELRGKWTCAAGAAGAGRLRGAGYLLGVVVLAGYVIHAGAFWPQVNDDAFITFRYAKFLALGRGPYFNPGEHVEGYTNFLMVPLMAAAWLVGGDDAVLPSAKVLGMLAGCAAVLASASLCRDCLRIILPPAREGSAARGLCWLAAALVAASSAVALNSTTGLETTLFCAFISLGLAAMARAATTRRWRYAGVFFALAALTRPEGVAVFGVAALLHGLTARRSSRGYWRRDAAIVACTCLAQLALRLWAYDGEFLPNTYYAKASGMPMHTPGQYLFGFAHYHLAAGTVGAAMARLLIALVAPSLMLLAHRTRDAEFVLEDPRNNAGGGDQTRSTHGTCAGDAPRPDLGPDWRVALPAAGVVAFGFAAVFATGPDWMPGYRLLVPYVPAWSALAVTSLVALVSVFTRRVSAVAWPIALVLAGGVFWAQWPRFQRDRRNCLTRAEGYHAGHEALARWLADATTPGQTVALMDIGIVGFRNPDLRILDVTGLTDRFIAKSPGEFLGKEFDPAYVFNRAPEVLVIVLHTAYEPDGTEDWNKLIPFTPIEERLLEHPEFRSHYLRPREVPPTADDLERLACLTGAHRVFRHSYPGRAYYLAAFRRDAE
ncbi:MAG: hypothetical protein IT449_08280 [Phycisphaerales bacterium]|nr:hypothetical protein [Phycisphaerales bacterium]